MKKAPWFAHRWLSVLLGMSWLLLQQSLAPVHLLSALAIGLVVPRMLHGFLPTSTAIRFVPALRLTAVVLGDIVTSNITVARLVLGPMRKLRPAWVPVPLELQNPTAISLLAAIITTTPGTVSCTVDESRRRILVHALDCADPIQMAVDIKSRYEAALMVIFRQSPDDKGGQA
jgi:multicomponent K+:H+ antiporter subunit E